MSAVSTREHISRGYGDTGDGQSPFSDRHISVSQIKTYLRCPLEYRFRYIDGLYVPQSGAITLGKSVHRALEYNFRQKIDSGKDAPLKDIVDVFNDAYDHLLEDTELEQGENAENLRREGMRLLSLYHATIAPGIYPAVVEEPFETELEGIDIPLAGIMDLVDRSGVIVDHKTAKRSYSSDAVQRDLQLTTYALAYRKMHGKQEKGVRLDVMIRGRETRIQTLHGERSERQIERHARLIGEVVRAIEQGIFYPNESYYCGICRYRTFCERW